MEDRQVERVNFFAGLPWSGAEAAAFDRHLQQELGLPGALLMENAGAAVARWAAQLAVEQGLTRIVLFCGPGHNGGDALVAARQLAGSGPRIELRFPLPPDQERAEAVRRWSSRLPDCSLAPAGAPLAPGSDLVVDGLFGLGLSRPLTGAAREAVESLNASGARILAVDLPSGLDPDRGEVLGAAVRAAHTLTFVAPKLGMTLGAGPACCGEVRVAGIGVSTAYAAAWLRQQRAAATAGS